ncbi:MAG: hypothetical protein ACN4E2_05685 [Nitrospinota bacterium]
MRVVTVALIILLSSATIVFAAAAKQISVPSPDTQPLHSIHFELDTRSTFFTKVNDGSNAKANQYGATYGIYDSLRLGVEIGLQIKEPSDDPFFFDAKLAVKEESIAPFSPAIAIGIYDVGTDTDNTDFNIAYGLIAKTFPIIGRLSVGYYSGNADILLNDEQESENQGTILSWDRTLAEIDSRLWVSIDYMGGNNIYGSKSVGFSWRFSPNIGMLVGYQIFNDTTLSKSSPSTINNNNLVTIQFDVDL